jgi:hypothetical protein
MPRRKTKKRSNRKKCGGENTSPNTRAAKNTAAKRIQSRFRGNKDRKVAKRKKLNKLLEDYDDYDVLNMIKMHMTGTGKKKKSKKLTRKKSKSRSKRGG